MDAILEAEEYAATLAPVAMTYSPSGLFVATVAAKNSTLGICVWDLASCGLAISASLDCPGLEGVAAALWHDSLVHVISTTGHLLALDPKTGTLSERSQIKGMADDDFIIGSHLVEGAEGDVLLATRRGHISRVQLASVHVESLRLSSATDREYSCAAFDQKGRFAILSQHRGNLVFFDIALRVDHSLDLGPLGLGANPFVHQLALHPRGNSLLLVLRDKTVRLAVLAGRGKDGMSLMPLHKFQDVINRWTWTLAGFSHDGEMVWATFYAVGSHLVYIWDANSGAFVKMIEGPREDLFLAAWDPKKPALITASVFGRLFRWTPDYPVKWSALVPGLEEIDDNVEYVEREDEFDLGVEEALTRMRHDKEASSREKDDATLTTLDLLSESPVPAEGVVLRIAS